MATFAELKEVRLRIDDPAGVIDILEAGSLPGSPIHQTAYKVSGVYYVTDVASPTADDWEKVDLYVSDDRLGTWFDTDGEDYACVRALEQIITKLGKELRLKRSDTGAESEEWTSLKELAEYYEDLLARFKADYNEVSSKAGPRWGGSSAPEIAGGNI